MPPAYLVGTGGFEPPTSDLSGLRANQLCHVPLQQGENKTGAVSGGKAFAVIRLLFFFVSFC